MAYNDVLTIPAHYNIYTGSNNREISIHYSIPDEGTNEETCIIVLVPGFGATVKSKVYEKMRRTFADKYNAVVIQCDYFGSEFMQDGSLQDGEFEFEELKDQLNREDYEKLLNEEVSLLQLADDYKLMINVNMLLDETDEYFADLGFLQAIDIITAIEAIKITLRQNGLLFNSKKIIGYGHSQGAYLLYVVNRLSPHLLTYIIDNCGWETPLYLYESRKLISHLGLSIFIRNFNYLVKRCFVDKEALSLNALYINFNNNAYTYSLAATHDDIVDNCQKKSFIESFKTYYLHVVDENEIDKYKFFSNTHGLNADFLNLFDYAWGKLPIHHNNLEKQMYYEICSSQTTLAVDYSHGLPLFTIVK